MSIATQKLHNMQNAQSHNLNNLQHTNTENIMADVIIIGAGPAGIFALFELGMLGMHGILLDGLHEIGGQCSALYPEKPIYDIPGFSKISGSELIQNLWQQAVKFKPEMYMGHKAKEINTIYNTDGKITHLNVITDKGSILSAKAVLLAMGGGAFGPNRPPLAKLELFEGKSIFYSVMQPAQFTKKSVVIAGGGDSAVDWAINLSEEYAAKVYLVHRRQNFRASPHSISKLTELEQAGKIELVVPFQLHAIQGHEDTGHLTEVHVKDNDENIRIIQADFLLPFFGLSMDNSELPTWNIDLVDHNKHISVDHTTMRTSRARIFAIGDIATYPGKLKLISVGFGEAAKAARAIYAEIYPEKILHFEYSTTKGLPA